ncbi:hypothetical protein [Okeania sp. SIO2B3]|uniref:hypothetical protein n=1 Tax=Okeania sp. SIO2B3 TaxID=2607784 RepID=UPI0013C110E8|nr:hypothetical protein [Okeania sp. SIO2B3]NET41828.1 hypothetical protein [Okeania sp. SIO2B3]
MNNSTIQGLTKQEETLFWGLINKILAQKVLPEASSNSTEKQFQLNFKVDKNGSIDVDSIQWQLVQIKSFSLFEESSTSTEEQLQFQLNIEENENSSTEEIDSINEQFDQFKSPSPTTPIVVVSLAAFALGFVVIPGIIISILTNSVIVKIFALIGWVVCVGQLTVDLFNGKTNWMKIITGFTGLFIIILLAIFR